jgi:hypothetical protein
VKSAPLIDAERCEASRDDGRRCTYRWTESVGNPGAHLPYRVCGIHKRQGERCLAEYGSLPWIWTHFWKRWNK